MNMCRVLVTGAGGFIGSHMVQYLAKHGCWVRGVDLVPPEFMPTAANEFLQLDLRRRENCLEATKGIEEVYTFAANMGGIGFIQRTGHDAEIMRDNVQINTHMLDAAREHGIRRLFYSSSACVYPTFRQERADISGLKEGDAVPAQPDNDYGWEKLFTEILCRAYTRDYQLITRVARFHNIYGPCGTWVGGREKAPAAICRKVAETPDGGSMEIWGDGLQTRSFCFIDDCVEGVFRLMHSAVDEPINIGSDEMVTVNQLADLAIAASGKRIQKRCDLTKPQGVRGRNSDNTLIRQKLGWAPSTSLRAGIAKTYPWIAAQVEKKLPRNAQS